MINDKDEARAGLEISDPNEMRMHVARALSQLVFRIGCQKATQIHHTSPTNTVNLREEQIRHSLDPFILLSTELVRQHSVSPLHPSQNYNNLPHQQIG